jgi:hypothetical protein
MSCQNIPIKKEIITMKQIVKNSLVLLFAGVLLVCNMSTIFAEDSLDLDKQAYVGTCQFSPRADSNWVFSCMNTDLDTKLLGVKIIAYRIKWSSGWSSWYVPGVNDLYKKNGEPLRRYWACFNDHNFEIIYSAPAKVW